MGFVRRLCAAFAAFAIVTSACSPTPEDHAGQVTETISTAPVIDSGPTPEWTHLGSSTVEELGALLGLSGPLLDTLVVEDVGSAIVAERWPEPSNEASVTPPTRVVTDVAIGDMAALAIRHEMAEGRAGIPVAGDSNWSIEVLDTGDVLSVVSLALRRDGAVSDVYMMGLDGTFVETHGNDGTWTATVRNLSSDGSTEVTELRPTGSGIAVDSAVSGLASPAGRSGSVSTLRRPAQDNDRDTQGWYCGPLTGAPRGLELLDAALDTFETAINDYLPRSEEFLRSISELIATVDVVSNVVSGAQSLTAGAVQRELGLARIGGEW